MTLSQPPWLALAYHAFWRSSHVDCVVCKQRTLLAHWYYLPVPKQTLGPGGRTFHLVRVDESGRTRHGPTPW